MISHESDYTHGHEIFQSVDFPGASGRTVIFVRFRFTNAAEIISLHTDMGCKFTRHGIVTLERQEPGNNEYPLPVLAVPYFDPILSCLPVKYQ